MGGLHEARDFPVARSFGNSGSKSCAQADHPAQLEQFVSGLRGKQDADLAYQIGDLELTERLSPERGSSPAS